MSKTVFVFPGQGAQFVGMGRDFYAASARARAIYETFNAWVAENLSQVCFEGPEEELKRTLYTQPAILATSLAALELFREQCSLRPSMVAGHSLGEYGALYTAGVIDLETAAKLISKRSELMEAAPKGAMSAVLGASIEQVETVIRNFRQAQKGVLTVANYNTDNQLVISGEPEAVETVAEPLKQVGAKRVLSLPVGGAFHSPLMDQAAETFSAFLQDFTFQNAAMPVVTNMDAAATTLGEEMRVKLGRQINHSVRWTQTMQLMHEQEVETVIEFGPGQVLTGMFKKMFPEMRVFNVYDNASLEATVTAMKVGVTAW